MQGGLTQQVWRLVRDERGATAIEYGLIAALVAVGALGGMSALGGGLGGSWAAPRKSHRRHGQLNSQLATCLAQRPGTGGV